MLAVLILFGGKNLPDIARTFGRTIRDLRRMWEETKRQMGLDALDDVKDPLSKPVPKIPPKEKES
jgi:Sec-independent protein translocase protein TatA